MTDDYITDHPYEGELRAGASCQYKYLLITGIKSVHGTGSDNFEQEETACARQAMEHAGAYQNDEQFAQTKDELCRQPAADHANPGPSTGRHLIYTHPHEFTLEGGGLRLSDDSCTYSVMDPSANPTNLNVPTVCGYPEQLHAWAERDRREAALKNIKEVVRLVDKAQYERAPMPDEARKGPVVTLIDAPVDPLGTLAVIGGIYTGKVARSKSEVTDEQRRDMLTDMHKTTLDGPLEAIQFTFLIEGVSRAFTHQAVRNRFSFFAQESLRFAVAEDWAQEVPLPPSLSAGRDEDPAVGIWRKALNAAEDAYAALVGAGMPAEEARGVLPHAITTRYYWTVSLRTLLQEAGKRTCTQAQFDWRVVFAGVAKALRERGSTPQPYNVPGAFLEMGDGWQYEAFADLIRPVCYQQGKCGFMAKFDRGCTIRARVDQNERAGRPSSEWGTPYRHIDQDNGPAISKIAPIDPAEWAADPAAARVVGDAPQA